MKTCNRSFSQTLVQDKVVTLAPYFTMQENPVEGHNMDLFKRWSAHFYKKTFPEKTMQHYGFSYLEGNKMEAFSREGYHGAHGL